MFETFVALVDENHPLAKAGAKGALSVEDYVRYPHILVSARGFVPGNVDAGLQQLGLHREIALTTPYFASAPRFLRGTDFILNMGRRLAGMLSEAAGVRTFELPVAVPGFDICMLWHPRNNSAKAHRWLRGEIEAVAANGV
jgi:DNA-binding transcriptional LysR family regulator